MQPVPHTHPQPPAPVSTRTYLFVGAFAIAAGVFTYRRPLHTLASSLRPTQTGRKHIAITASSTRAFQTFANTDMMFGGGQGVEVPARGAPSAALIFMHGLGDSGEGWAPAFPLRGLDHVRTILPSAPVQSVTLNMGYQSPSWFDLEGLGEDAPDDEDGIMESVARVNRIIDHQVAQGIPSERIVVAGFSQGGALALTAGLRSERRLAGIVSLSCWLPMRSKYPTMLSDVTRDTEIFMGHGTADQVIDFKFGEKSADFIRSLDRKIHFHAYAGLTHSSSAEGMNDVRDFVARLLPPL